MHLFFFLGGTATTRRLLNLNLTTVLAILLFH